MKKLLLSIAALTFLLATSTLVFAAGTAYFPAWEMSSTSAPDVIMTNFFMQNTDTVNNTVTITAYSQDGNSSRRTWRALTSNDAWVCLGTDWLTGNGFNAGTANSYNGLGTFYFGAGVITSTTADKCAGYMCVYNQDATTGFAVPIYDAGAGTTDSGMGLF